MKSRSREIGCYNYCITLKFDRHLDSYRVAFQISERLVKSKPESRGFETSQDLAGNTSNRLVNIGPSSDLLNEGSDGNLRIRTSGNLSGHWRQQPRLPWQQ